MSNIENWNLWKLFKNKADSAEFRVAVKKVCETGINLSNTIMLTFPNFTLHDETHIRNVCDWMCKLLSDEEKNNLTAIETAMLLMSACCHDIGMCVFKNQKEKLLNNVSTSQWKKYFERFPQDYSKINDKNEQDRIIRNFIRIYHHERVREALVAFEWPDDLKSQNIYLKDLTDLCKSHGESLNDLKCLKKYDTKLCAVLLRLADVLDFGMDRVPDVLLHSLGINSPKNTEEEISKKEWDKNSAGSFRIENGKILFSAEYDKLQLEKDVLGYVEYVKQELDSCREYLSGTDTAKRIQIPYLSFNKDEDIVRNGYISGDFCLTMDQDKIMQLLTGKNLYSDSEVFVRELLQNSIDAIMTHKALNNRLEGKISIRTWTDNEGYSWFRIKDNGIGMDEEIIKKYLLKIGRSYYQSDDFQKLQKEHTIKNKPISRFGIGILSCFMNDPNTLVEISTKRFLPQKECPAVRMSIEGLHGYYYVANEEKQPEYDINPMPSPDDSDTGYRTEYGTIICVRVNLYKTGEHRSFKEIVEKYVQFPEVKVEYHGEDGKKEFPTQDDFMTLVHSLNPDGAGAEPKVYKHPIPDDKFEELKEKCPWATFTEKPIINFQYYPLDWLSGDENIQGVSVKVSTNSSFKVNDPKYDSHFSVEKFSNKMRLNAISDKLYERYEQYRDERYENKRKFESISIEYQDLSETNYSENKLWEYLLKYGRMIVYNGILADTKSIKEANILLLNSEYLPEVDIARDKIIGLPTKAAFTLEKTHKKLRFLESYDVFVLKKDLLLTEKELFELLKQNPEWENDMTFGDKKCTLSQLKEAIKSEEYIDVGLYDKKSLLDNVSLAVLKKHFTVCYKKYDLHIKKKETYETDTSEFPVQLFFSFYDKSKFAYVGWRINLYNKKHPFSQWLIKNQKELMEKVPGIYNSMIDKMIFGKDKTEILDFLNASLKRLKTYQHNFFGIKDDLFLKNEDFV